MRTELKSPDHVVPSVLELSIGNGREGYYVVRLLEAGAVAWSFERGAETEQAKRVVPTSADWLAFAAELDRIGVFGWEESYADPSVLDGTYWSVRCSRVGRSVVSSGANAFPDRFLEFCGAVERLVGGRTFR